MNEKGMELPWSTVITILIVIIFFIVMIALYATWREQAYELADTFFGLFGR